MDCFVGIDLGSTTTKAVYLDSNFNILGRGITNSRSNYGLACRIAEEEAENNARFTLLGRDIEARLGGAIPERFMEELHLRYELAEYRAELRALGVACQEALCSWDDKDAAAFYKGVVERILAKMGDEAHSLFTLGTRGRDKFFRDLAGSRFLDFAQHISDEKGGVSFERLIGVFDRAIIAVEGKSFAGAFSDYIDFASHEVAALPAFKDLSDEISASVAKVKGAKFNVVNIIGTGYGRQTLPFPKERIRSEILCHGLGAHYMFPKTRTVLDIGGQDTKAIQVDGNGVVTGFQMNDRCAAGCGRYLGYVADEMNIGVHELGPLALKAERSIRINSTCTVFAGSEIRDRLSLGEKRNDILAGLHRAIMLRAMSLIARSGGITNEFTFTGGVARNSAATKVLGELIAEHYGDGIKINISADSIYTGSCGAALFAQRERDNPPLP